MADHQDAQGVSIRRPAVEVWAFVTDLAQTPRWRSTIRAIDPPARLEVGERFSGTTRLLARNWRWTLEITAADAPRRFAYTVVDGVARITVEYLIEPTPDGCRFTMAGAVDDRTLLARAIEPLAIRALRRETAAHLRGLKSLLEESDGEPPADAPGEPDRQSLRALERDALGAPVVPPAAATIVVNAVRRRLLTMHRAMAPAPLRVVEAMFTQFDARALATLVELGIPDLLDGPTTVDELAERTATDPDRLERLLRFAAARGLLTADRRGRFGPNGLTSVLRSDAGSPWQGWVQFASSEWFGDAWRRLGPSLRPGAPPAFDAAHGTDFFDHTTTDREAGAVFDRAMEAGATLQAIGLARGIDWSSASTVCDVGGGTGMALEVLQRYHPHLDVTLLDLPEVVADARIGVRTERPGRRAIVGGSFFDPLPAGHDRYLLLAIVHDWDDERAVSILARVRQAMAPHSEAIVVETPLATRPRDDFATATDLLMFVLATGKERTEEQYAELAAEAGLVIDRRQPLPTGSTAFVLRA